MSQREDDQLEAAHHLAETFDRSSGLLGATLGPHLTCTEVEALADFLRAFGHGELADELIDGHADSDEEGDLHFPEESLATVTPRA